MQAKHYPFQVGSIPCAVLLDGAAPVSRERMLRRFPDATEAEYRQAYADIGLSFDAADSSFNILLIRLPDQTLLVDSGEGGRPTGGHLPQALRLAGLTTEDITQVILTHTHGDHVLGLLSDEGQPVFPNARYVISRPELAFWQARIAGSLADQAPILAMMEAQGLRRIEMDEQIGPGLKAVPIPGHTPGQIALLLESEGEKLLHLADLLHSPMQFAHPEWSPYFDADADVSVPTRRTLLRRAADEDLLALFYHLTFPGLGRIRQAEKGFAWQPVKPR